MDIGSVLKQARNLKKLSLADVEEATKIRIKYLQSMEENNFSKLPPGMYRSAFLRTYARFLGLDADELVAAYRQEYAAEPAVPAEDEAHYTEVRPLHRTRRRIWGALAAMVILAAGLGIFTHPFRHPSAPSPPPAQSASPAPSPAAQQPAPQPTGTNQVTPAAGLNLVLRVTHNDSWLKVTVDGTLAYEGFLYAGQQKDFTGSNSIKLTLGNAGAVKVTLNGQNLGYLGGAGKVVNQTFPATSG